MLTGRESLIRLIGKHRRVLPNRHSIISPQIQNYVSDIIEDEDGATTFFKCGKSGLKEGSENGGSIFEEDGSGKAEASNTSDSVKCPVCDNAVRGGEKSINTHLDVCLARGTKRKLTQPTLLQLNCWSRSVKIEASESDNLDYFDDTMVCNNLHKLLDVRPLDENISNEYRSTVKSELADQFANGFKENTTTDDTIQCNWDAPLFPIKNEKLKSEKALTVDDISGEILETFIVGRRFTDEVEINIGTCISLRRDTNNVKDPNAIQVLSTESGCCKVLGFIPRELALYLSPFIEKFCLNFEGRVMSVPEHSHDVVKIQISCQTVKSFSGKEHDDLFFEFSWENVRRVVESAKTNPPTMKKYHQNFSLIIEEVLRSYSHLFTDNEVVFLGSFKSLPDDSQRLFVRLYTRKGPWFRMSNINYPEITNYQVAVKQLSETNYMCCFQCVNELHDDDMKEILCLLTKPELHEVSCMIKKKCNQGIKKQDMISTILSSYKDGFCPYLPSIIRKKTGDCIQISATADSLIWRAERLFFLNGGQDLSAFLLVDLGIVKYPTYNCIFTDSIFSNRNDLLAYEEALEVAQIMDESLDTNDSKLVLRCIALAKSGMSYSRANAAQLLASESVDTFLSCFSAPWIYSKVVLLGVSFFERERRYRDAISLLQGLLGTLKSDGRRGYWTLRLSIDMEHVGRCNESLSIAEDGLLDPWVRAGSKIALQRRVLRLGKPPRRWKVPSFSESIKRKITEVHVIGRPLNSEMGMKSRFYGEDGDQCGVEELALQYYATEEGGSWQGVHTETGIWLTIFGLLMWDIIFADVPNVFRTKFQTAPLDLDTDSFYPSRKGKIESHLEKIHDGMAEEILLMSWESNVGTSCRGVNWSLHSLSVLRAAVTCVGGPCLASLCRHLAQDYRSWAKGMPDLLLWRFHDDYKGEAKLVEVKGPRDRLSEQQRAWLLFLMDCGFNAEVCKVSPLPISACKSQHKTSAS